MFTDEFKKVFAEINDDIQAGKFDANEWIIETKAGKKVYVDVFNFGELLSLVDAGYIVKRKPKTINVNGIDVPLPLREAPEHKTPVFVAGISAYGKSGYMINFDVDSEPHAKLLNRGLLHRDKEAAKAHFEALTKPSSNRQEAADIHEKDLISFTKKGD